MLPNTDCTCNVCQWHFEHVRSDKNTQSGEIISSTEPLLWTLRPRPPLPPLSRWAKGQNYLGESRSLDGQSSFPNCKYSPSESESVNNICNTSSQYKFVLVIWRFSLKNLTIYLHAIKKILQKIEHFNYQYTHYNQLNQGPNGYYYLYVCPS